MFITFFKKENKINNLSYDDFAQLSVISENNYYKVTNFIENPKLSKTQKQHLQICENAINKAHALILPFINKQINELYYTFKIPKRSGGLRTIHAPYPEFKETLSKIKQIFEDELKCLAHNNAFAYVKNRTTLDALKKHQNNASNWYLKIDLKDFFPSCTVQIIFKHIKQLYPFYWFNEDLDNKLIQIIKTCSLENGLPQGTPLSPLLTNLIMIPYDHALSALLTRNNGEHFVYTRYADDIIISCKNQFDWKKLQEKIQEILTPDFTINYEKTRYGSKAGRNWNLGLKINKDNNITLGFQEKKILNAMLNNFLKDYANNIIWSKEDTQYIQGKLSYLNQIEPTYYQHIISKYQNKYKVHYKSILKAILNS